MVGADFALYSLQLLKQSKHFGSTAAFALLCATIMASHVTYQVVFLVRNHSCTIDFSSSHFYLLPLNFAHYILVYYLK